MVLEDLEGIWGHPGGFWEAFAGIWEALGGSWAAFGAFWRHLEAPRRLLGGRGAPRNPEHPPSLRDLACSWATLLHPDGWIQDTGYNMQHPGYRNQRMEMQGCKDTWDRGSSKSLAAWWPLYEGPADIYIYIYICIYIYGSMPFMPVAVWVIQVAPAGR